MDRKKYDFAVDVIIKHFGNNIFISYSAATMLLWIRFEFVDKRYSFVFPEDIVESGDGTKIINYVENEKKKFIEQLYKEEVLKE